MQRSIVLTALLLFSFMCHAQSTITNLWLFDLSYDNEQPHIEHARKITDTHAYTNQPYFYDDNQALYYTQSFPAGSVSQTDVMKFDISRGFHSNLTHTADSEYSPTPLPHKKGFSAIRVDKRKKQWLWLYTHKQNNKFSALEPIGYHVWMGEDEALAFVLGDTHTLQRVRADLPPTVVDSNIGPSLWAIPDTGLFSYTKNPAPDKQPWTLMSYDPATERTSLLATLPKGAYYMAWSPGAKALAAVETRVYAWDFKEPVTPLNETSAPADEKVQGPWQVWLELQEYCPGGASRLHMSTDGRQLAAVCHEADG